MPKNVGDMGKLIVVKGFERCLKSNKSPNLVTLVGEEKDEEGAKVNSEKRRSKKSLEL